MEVEACTPEDMINSDSTQGSRGYPNRMRSGIFRPENCFRLVGAGAGGKAAAGKKGPDFLSGYSLEMSPTGADVDWGSKVDWDENPFEDLTCDPMTVAVADELDVCSLFEEEVAQATRGEWTVVVMWDTVDADAHHAMHWTAVPKTAPTAERFSTLWFDDDLDEKVKNKNQDRPLAGARDRELHDLYNNNDDADNNLNVIWQLLTNTDGSPNRGDFGKVDHLGPDGDDEGDAMDRKPDGIADNYADTREFRAARKCSDDDGEGCDAKWNDSWDVTFADGTFGCTAMASVAVTCTWDAQGMIDRGTAAADEVFDATSATDKALYYTCTANK